LLTTETGDGQVVKLHRGVGHNKSEVALYRQLRDRSGFTPDMVLYNFTST
jgi:hypothetical protein